MHVSFSSSTYYLLKFSSVSQCRRPLYYWRQCLGSGFEIRIRFQEDKIDHGKEKIKNFMF
jgi:hypothetical protein